MKEILVIVVAIWAIVGSAMGLWFIGQKLEQSLDKDFCIPMRNDAQMYNGYEAQE